MPGAAQVFHAATARSGTALTATGGRVLTVVATAPGFDSARREAYAALGMLQLDGAQFRTDIAQKVLR